MPLSPTDRGLLILVSLAEGEKHGYALMQDIESFAGVRLTPGSLYGAIGRLEQDGYIEALPTQERRHPYRITSTGGSVLRRELARSAHVAAVGETRLRANPIETKETVTS